jgi:hypothetical protein
LHLDLVFQTYQVRLRAPDLGDIKRYSSGAVKRQLKGLVPRIFKDPSWPVIENYQFSFSSLTAAQKTDFENLYEAAIGQSITLYHSYGVTLTGYITNKSIEVLTEKDLCAYSLEFEFLATVISYPVGDCLPTVNTTPLPGAANFFSTLENDTNYQLYDETRINRLQSETGDYLYPENI